MNMIRKALLLLTLIGLSTACTTTNRHAKTKSDSKDPNARYDIYEMVEKFDESKYQSNEQKNEHISFTYIQAELEQRGVKVSQSRSLCRTKKETDKTLLKRVELETELGMMISNLKSRPQPRQLQDSEKYILSQAQNCQEFLSDLMAITDLLNGMDDKVGNALVGM